MDVPLKEPLTKEWFKKYAEKRGLELIIATDENVAVHLQAMKFSEVVPLLKVRSTDTGDTFIAIAYKRPEPAEVAS